MWNGERAYARGRLKFIGRDMSKALGLKELCVIDGARQGSIRG